MHTTNWTSYEARDEFGVGALDVERLISAIERAADDDFELHKPIRECAFPFRGKVGMGVVLAWQKPPPPSSVPLPPPEGAGTSLRLDAMNFRKVSAIRPTAFSAYSVFSAVKGFDVGLAARQE